MIDTQFPRRRRSTARSVPPRGFACKTRLGWIGIGYTDRGIALVTERKASEGEVEKDLQAHMGPDLVYEQMERAQAFGNLGRKLQRYLDGEPVQFDEPVDLSELAPFSRAVLEATYRIPYGEVRTYGDIAREIGRPRAFRAVGQALHNNPIGIIIPCHRVVGSDGKLVGYGWGVDMKRDLLEMERRGSRATG